MTREEIDKFLNNTKVYVDGKSKEIQEKLFKFGYSWGVRDRNVSYTDQPFIYISDKYLSCSSDMEFFIKNPNLEISAEQILSLKLTEPTYRPFKDAKECWKEMLKHQPVGWLINKNLGVIENIATITSDFIICPYPIGFDKGLENYLFADDTPFGIKEE